VRSDPTPRGSPNDGISGLEHAISFSAVHLVCRKVLDDSGVQSRPMPAILYSPTKAILTIFVLLVVGRCGVLAQNPHTDPHFWKTYTNVRFQYSICYPEDLIIPQGEVENSDGQRFTGNDGATLIVYGRHNALGQSLKQIMDETSSRLAGKSGKVTYKMIKPNWFVVSGVNESSIFYAKTLRNHAQLKSFELTYSQASAATYQPLVPRISGCFHDLAH
jgi:hypothetical protein